MSNQPNRVSLSGLYWGTALVLVVAYAGFVLLLWRVGVFDFPETDAAAEVLAAIIGLLGGLFVASLTFAGVLLKHSVDERNLARLELEGKRNLELKKEAEDRLKLDTFIRAAGLLATDAGTKAPPTQQAAALFALADLNHLRFGLALLGEMWREGDVSPSTACWLIDKCLQSDDEYLQATGADILAINAVRLSTFTECFAWPEVLETSWPTHLPDQARIYILLALLRCLLSRRADEWDSGCLIVFVIYLERIKKEEKADERLRDGAVLCLDALLGHAEFVHSLAKLILGRDAVDLAELRPEVRALAQNPTFRTYTRFVEVANELREWAKGTAPEPSAPSA